MKIFQIKSLDTIRQCRWYFGITDTITKSRIVKREIKFLAKYCNAQSSVTCPGAVLWGPEGRGPLWPPTAPSKVNDAGILLKYVVIVMCICERCFMYIVCNFTLLLGLLVPL